MGFQGGKETELAQRGLAQGACFPDTASDRPGEQDCWLEGQVGSNI